MARLRATFFFKNTAGAGWTETIFSNAPNLEIALINAKLLIPPRVALLGQGVNLAFIRVSDDLVKRDSKIYAVPDADGKTKSRAGGNADIANTCLLLRVEAGDLKRRSLFLRGIPDAICDDNGTYLPTPAFTANLIAYSAFLTAGTWAVRVRADVGAPVDITNVSTVGPTGLVTITTAAAHGLIANNVANIRAVLGATQVRGLQKVVTVGSATTYDIRVSRVVKPYLGAGNSVKNDYTLVTITNVSPIRCSHHNAGRPFDSPRGRRRVA